MDYNPINYRYIPFLHASQGPQHCQGRDALRRQGGDRGARNAQAGANPRVLGEGWEYGMCPHIR